MGQALRRCALLLVLALVGCPTPVAAQEMRTLLPAVPVPLHSVVDVSTLPPPSPVAPSASTVPRMKPFLTPDPDGLREWRELLEQAPGVLPPAPEIIQDAGPRVAAPRVVAVAPAVATQFEGLANTDNVALTGFSTLPPDDNLGVGPSHVFQMVNIVGRITDKAGTAASSFSLNGFFSVDAGFDESDPRVIYDAVSGRWFAVYLEFSATLSSLLLAVSASSDPVAGSFCVYRVGDPANSGFESFLQDFPMIGVSDDKVVLSYNGFDIATGTSFQGAGIYVLNKADLTGCAATVRMTRFAPSSSRFTPHPAQSLGSTTDLHLAMHVGSSSTLTLLTVSGVPGVTTVTESSTVLTIRPWAPPPLARQAGSSVQLDTGDDSVLSVSWQNGSLWVAGNEACIPSGDSRVRSCLRLIEVLTSGPGSPSVNQDMTVGATGEYYYYPALRPTGTGDVLMVFTRSSESAFASVRIIGRLATDPVNTFHPSSELRSGGGPQLDSSGRMGDYSGAAVDPSDTSTVWVIGEYIQSSGNANWGTFVAQLYFGPPPSTLTVTRAGTGGGTVTSQPTGIACGGACAATYAFGTIVTLTATPAANSSFDGWSGGGCSGTGPCTLTLSADTAVTATFTLLPTLTLNLNQPTFDTGDTLRVDVTVANPGPERLVDVYFGALLPPAAGPGLGCPGGDAIAFVADAFARVVVTCLSAPPQGFAPLFQSLGLPGALPTTTVVDFFTFVWAPDLPAGPYTIFLVLTPPDAFADGSVDATDLLATALAGLTFAP